MKIILEGKEYEFVANGKFMKKYQETFNSNLILALYEMSQKRDIYTCSKLIYCGINVEKSFDEWLDEFETPLFALNVMDTVMEYITRSTTPTVESKGKENDLKKKTT